MSETTVKIEPPQFVTQEIASIHVGLMEIRHTYERVGNGTRQHRVSRFVFEPYLSSEAEGQIILTYREVPLYQLMAGVKDPMPKLDVGDSLTLTLTQRVRVPPDKPIEGQ